MTKTTTSNTKTSPSSVKIIGSKLILSLPDAQMPVVWQVDLDQAQSSAFTIQEDKKAKSFSLVSKLQDGSINEIAIFSNKQESVDILMEISDILQNPSSQIKVSITPNNDNPNDNKKGAIIALSLIGILIIIWILSASNNLNTATGGSDVGSNAQAQGSSGVAISADDFLNNR